MCKRCDNKLVAKRWLMWSGIVLTLVIFISSQIFMYGKVVGVFQEHIKLAPTYRVLDERYVEQGEFDIIKDMIFYLYKKEGGK